MGGYNEQKSSSKESQLSLEQAKILRSRESLFENWYLPEVKGIMQEFSPDSAAGKAAMSLNAQQINSSFNAAQKQTNQDLAQRNMLYSGAGAALTQANERARSSALANAYSNQMATSTGNKANMLANMSTLMPSTTNAAPTLSTARSQQISFG